MENMAEIDNNKSRYALDIKSATEKFDDFFKRIQNGEIEKERDMEIQNTVNELKMLEYTLDVKISNMTFRFLHNWVDANTHDNYIEDVLQNMCHRICRPATENDPKILYRASYLKYFQEGRYSPFTCDKEVIRTIQEKENREYVQVLHTELGKTMLYPLCKALDNLYPSNPAIEELKEKADESEYIVLEGNNRNKAYKILNIYD